MLNQNGLLPTKRPVLLCSSLSEPLKEASALPFVPGEALPVAWCCVCFSEPRSQRAAVVLCCFSIHISPSSLPPKTLPSANLFSLNSNIPTDPRLRLAGSRSPDTWKCRLTQTVLSCPFLRSAAYLCLFCSLSETDPLLLPQCDVCVSVYTCITQALCIWDSC